MPYAIRAMSRWTLMLGLGLCLAIEATPSVSAAPLDTVFIGDSITLGRREEGLTASWHRYLYEHQTLGEALNFVGAERTSFWGETVPGDFNHHAGFGGARISDVRSHLASDPANLWTQSPDVVGVMLGTNDLSSNPGTVTGARDAMNALLGDLRSELDSSTEILLAQLPPKGAGSPDGNFSASLAANVSAFNDELATLVDTLRTSDPDFGNRIHLVDFENITLADLGISDAANPDLSGFINPGSSLWDGHPLPVPDDPENPQVGDQRLNPLYDGSRGATPTTEAEIDAFLSLFDENGKLKYLLDHTGDGTPDDWNPDVLFDGIHPGTAVTDGTSAIQEWDGAAWVALDSALRQGFVNQIYAQRWADALITHVVPEPASVALIGAGTLLLLARRPQRIAREPAAAP